jgi:hypothetical protein
MVVGMVDRVMVVAADAGEAAKTNPRPAKASNDAVTMALKGRREGE